MTDFPARSPVTIKTVEAFVFRVPLERPVSTSFGTMRDRPAVLVRLEDEAGTVGWGEIWCNWPACGAEHRARLLVSDIAPRIVGRPLPAPPGLWKELAAATEILALQTGEAGPYAQVIAGLDMAYWDLTARRRGKSLATALSPRAATSVRAYASGIHIRDAQAVVAQARAVGYRDFKVKVGFDFDQDLVLIRSLADSLEPGETLYADANQGFLEPQARAFLSAVEDLELGWMEEPVRVDCPDAVWSGLAEITDMPLAGGENLIGLPAFEAAIAAGHLSVIQPDAAKWGGVSGCFSVAKAALAAGRRYCPHFLGAGIGLVASAHILAAAGGNGLLEIDVNGNPLRDAVEPGWPVVRNGSVVLPDGPGLGLVPDLERLARFETLAVAFGQS
ncbi:MAG: mandelate racemase/muconate lactonizing enzyme family protein [Alphaproteobacteria bacterium]|nr:mandelate racemase/muconate lactonizing enzyme family protein [Alphaproteobacteria bacterium]MBU1551546.1 mandelate racemase/muconate lactonizing enzyme family protein [Alphaproteobacteria bacterium]MBU2337281.1 mandelate racemase/muconate lactonizing enzyme family protein [Alphaproteobacteria bacterium]MBU2388024.1 mandelate racemase/muconate lactonizing enzyme family protein [Alphaproteobacteria bacterium]